MRSRSNALLRVVINVDPYNYDATFLVGDDACDIPKPFRATSLTAKQINLSVGMVTDHP